MDSIKLDIVEISEVETDDDILDSQGYSVY